jgi:hypothetical protein
METRTFEGRDEREIENQILKWRAARKIHPFKRVDAVGTPSVRFIKRTAIIKRTARGVMTRTIDYVNSVARSGEHCDPADGGSRCDCEHHSRKKNDRHLVMLGQAIVLEGQNYAKEGTIACI